MFQRILKTLFVVFTALFAWLIYTVLPDEGVVFALCIALIPSISFAFLFAPLVSNVYLAWRRFKSRK